MEFVHHIDKVDQRITKEIPKLEEHSDLEVKDLQNMYSEGFGNLQRE